MRKIGIGKKGMGGRNQGQVLCIEGNEGNLEVGKIPGQSKGKEWGQGERDCCTKGGLCLGPRDNCPRDIDDNDTL